MTDLSENKRIVAECLDAFKNSDVAALGKVIADDAEIWVPEGTRFSGTYTPAAYIKNLGDAVYPLVAVGGEHRMDILSMTAEEDRVSVEAISYLELNNSKVYNNKYHFMFRLKDGVIVQIKEYLNTQHVVDVFH